MTFYKTASFILFLFHSFILISQDFQIDKYDVDILLNNDGSFDITEKIDVNFNKKMRGVYRIIPTSRDVGTFIQNAIISNINTGNTKSKITKRGDEVEIRLGESDKYLIGQQSYIISYTVDNAITPYAEHDEFYWSLTGNEWKEKIMVSNFKIQLPNDIQLSENDVAVFTDKNSSAQHANVNIDGRVISGRSLSELGNGEGITVAFKTPKGYYSELDYGSIVKQSQNASARSSRKVEEKVYPRDWGFPLPAILIGSLLFFFNRTGKNGKRSFIDEPHYYPPAELNPPEIGVFHDFQVNKRDLISLIPYWGEQGFLKVASLQKDDGSMDMRFEKQKELPIESSSYEKEFFNSIFKTSDLVYLHDLENEMYKSFNSVGKSLKTEVLDMKLYDQESKKRFHSGRFILIGILSFISAIVVGVVFHAVLSAVLLGILGIVCLYVHFHRPKKNEVGLDIHDHLVALKRTLQNPDPNSLSKIIKEDPKYLEKIFPYVVAFGLDKSWSENVEPIFDKAPDWYYGDDVTMRPDFNAFNKSFSIKTIGKTMTSSPVADDSSSAFGGSSSGGFSGSSGGGFGGSGGGGGW